MVFEFGTQTLYSSMKQVETVVSNLYMSSSEWYDFYIYS